MALTGELVPLLGVFALAFVVRLLVTGVPAFGFPLVREFELVAVAAALVVAVRAVVVYGLVNALNAAVEEPIPLPSQHVLVWGGLHTVVPVALVVSLPPGIPFRSELRVMVLGVAVLGPVTQGLLMPSVLRVTGVT